MTTSLRLNNPHSICNLKKIKAIEFGLFSPNQIARMSVCEVANLELYENGVPKSGALNDLKMGTSDPRLTCATCNMDYKHCVGHFGHINLAKPVYHVGFLRIVVSILRCVCYGCSRLLGELTDAKGKWALRCRNPKKRFQRILKLCHGKSRCEASAYDDEDVIRGEGCGCIQPKYFKDGISITIQTPNSGEEEGDMPDDIYYGGDKSGTRDSKRPLTAEEAIGILQRISNRDLEILGFNPERNHPAWMVLTVLPVPPPIVRPYVQYGSDRSEDDLTLKLLDIIKTNQQYIKQDHSGAAQHVLSEISQLLQFHVATFMNNDLPGIPIATTRAKRPIKSLRQRLKGKEGRLRGNLMGKRVDFAARTVITGDPNINIDEVGVPKSVAMNLTFPEVVTSMNIDKLKQLVLNGPYVWPGAKYISREDGTRYDLRHCQGNLASQQLYIGDFVERHMQDGDYILFNRQPSLHKMSIMGHKVKILPWSTFRLNLSVTSPYNADFDGDEMNLHLAQSHETRAEIKHLMLVNKQIVSPQGNKPVMGIVQDSLLGVAKLTKRDTFLTKDEIMNLLMWIPYWDGKLMTPAILRPKPYWTGKQLFTALLTFDQNSANTNRINLYRDGAIRMKNDNEWLSENDGRVIIRNNEHLAGIICRRTAGSSTGSLIHILWLEAGPEKTKQFLSVCQRVVGNWLITHGFTVGCGDIVAPQATYVKVIETLKKSAAKVQELIIASQKGQLETQPGKSLLQSFEARVNQELNSARESAGRIASENLDEHNNIFSMVNAGSKGSTINISQIMACVGQQNVEGKRIPFGFKDRSLPHFVKHDYGPESRGFVFNSYLTGLNPQEMFFHAMGGREGIIDTACKTSETGYIQRRLIKAMEDVLVTYDRTVRSSESEIVQFLYGEDGMAGEFIEDQMIPLLRMDFKKMEAMYRHDFANHNYGLNWIPNEAIRNSIRLSFEQQRILENEWQQLLAAKETLCTQTFTNGEAKQHLPINLARLIEFAQNRFLNESLMNMNPVKIVQQVDSLIESLTLVQITSESDYIAKEVQSNGISLLQIHIKTHLASRKLMEVNKIGPEGLKWILGELSAQFYRALAHPGEVVGAIAAQSIGEPATQMTLNTFHFAGVGSKNVTLGVPRLRELINVAKNVKTPSMSVYLKPQIAKDQDAAKSVQAHLEHATLDRVISYAQVVYDPNPTETIIKNDAQWVSEYYELPDDEENPAKLGPWVLRIQFIEKLITEKGLTMREIGDKIQEACATDEIDCIWTDDNSEDLVLRIRVKNNASNKDNSDEEPDLEEQNRLLKRLMSHYLSNISLRGIQGIQKVYMREEKSQEYDKELGTFIPSSQWVLDTDGCNLKEVLCVKEVDATKTISNDILEVLQVFGIEAARRALLKEFRAVISFDGSYVNYRHLAALCDIMTHTGSLMSITRNGINRIEKGCLAKCSFEETVEILMAAAAFGDSDHLKAVTENVMFGQLAKFGTGMCDLVIDEQKLRDTNPNYNLSTMMSITSTDGGNKNGLEDLVSPDANIALSPKTASQLQPVVDFIASPFSPTSPLSPLLTSPNTTKYLEPLSDTFSPQQSTPSSPFSPKSLSPISSPLLQNNMMPNDNTGVISPFSTTLITSPQYSPTSPIYTSATSPNLVYSPSKKENDYTSYSPTSPVYNLDNNKVNYSPTSPTYSPQSPLGLSPTSPYYTRFASPNYSPQSPAFSPESPLRIHSPGAYSLTSPNYSPTSPTYINTMANAAPLSPEMIVASPRYDPQSVAFDGTSYSPTSPIYSPTSPIMYYSPSSPSYQQNTDMNLADEEQDNSKKD